MIESIKLSLNIIFFCYSFIFIICIFIILEKVSKPLAPTTINRYKIRACNKRNIRPIKLHQFRHSHATYLLNKKIDIHIISKRLGHSKVSTTLDVYTHSNLLQEKRLIKSLNSRFSLF